MEIILPRPQPKQREFMAARSRYVGFGGARGGGKSFGVRLKARSLALVYPGIRMLLVRRTYPELMENHIKPLVSDTAGWARYRDSDKSLTFATGAVLKFGYCDSDADVLQYQGQEFDIIFMDEATQFTEYWFDCIRACLRGVNGFPKRMYITCNPGGVGHGWVKRLFVDREYRPGEKPEDYTFVRSRVYDNAALMQADPDYLRTLESLPDDLRKAWLDGEWDLFAGQYFSEWRRDVHVAEDAQIPDHWVRVCAMDYGLDMLAAVWAAFDEHGHGIVYRELCAPDLPAAEAARAILAASLPSERNARGGVDVIAPPDLWARAKDTGRSIEEIFRENGVWFSKADNNRVAGWMNLRDWLRVGEDGVPGLRFLSSCRECVRCIPLLQHDKRNSLDCAGDPHDITHAPDAVRYLVQSRPPRAKALDLRSADERMIDDYKRSRFSGNRGGAHVIRRYG